MARAAADLDTGNILFESENKGAFVSSTKRWFVRFRVEVWSLDQGAGGPARPVLTHDYDATGQEVLIHFPVGTLGDILAWFPYAARFAQAHPGCRVTCALSALIIPLLQDAYPELRLVTHEQVAEERLAERAYAAYHLGLFFDDLACDWQPTDFRHVGLHKTAAYILGVPPEPEEAPRLVIPDADSAPARRALRLHRGAEQLGLQVLEQSRTAGAAVVALPQGRRLPGGVPGPEAGARGGADVGAHPARGGGPDRRPAAWPSARAGSSTRTCSWGCPAGLRGWPGRPGARPC